VRISVEEAEIFLKCLPCVVVRHVVTVPQNSSLVGGEHLWMQDVSLRLIMQDHVYSASQDPNSEYLLL